MIQLNTLIGFLTRCLKLTVYLVDLNVLVFYEYILLVYFIFVLEFNLLYLIEIKTWLSVVSFQLDTQLVVLDCHLLDLFSSLSHPLFQVNVLLL